MTIRLNRAIALSGFCSRRAADQLIADQRVKVNGQDPNGPGMSVGDTDCIKIDNKKIEIRKNHHYFIFHKPKGYVCSKRRLYPNQKLIYDLIDRPGLFTVGRLDKDTTGLIILTSDGLLAQKIIHPSSGIEKEYIVKVTGLNQSSILKMKEGVFIQGTLVVPRIVKEIAPNQCKIVVMEGKNREIRRLCQKANLDILSLKRVRIGRLSLNELKSGHYRECKKEQILQFFDGQKIPSSPK